MVWTPALRWEKGTRDTVGTDVDRSSNWHSVDEVTDGNVG